MVREQRRLYCLCHGFLSTTTTTTTNTTTTTATSITTAAYRKQHRQHHTITCRKVLSNQIEAEVDTQLHKINTSHHRAPHTGDHV